MAKIGKVGKIHLTYRRGFEGLGEFAWVSQSDFDELKRLHELYLAIWEAIHDPRIILSDSMRRRMEREIGQIVFPSRERLLSLRPKIRLYNLTGRDNNRAVDWRDVGIQLAVITTIEFVDVHDVIN